MKSAVSAAAFEAKYRRSHDPWRFALSPYEQHRYAITLQALAQAHYSRAFEPGCSVGVLTAALAGRCDSLFACDISPTAVRLARRRCAALPNVHIYRGDVVKSLPAGCFDLIVFSEIGYYFSAAALAKLVGSLAKRLAHGGEFIAVHWRGESKDHVLHGDEAHAILAETLGQCCAWLKGQRYVEFRWDVWRHV